MVAGWVQSKYLIIQHVGKPGHRVPIGGVARLESPSNARPSQASLDIWVLGDVLLVIIIDEPVEPNRAISSESHCRQQQTEHQHGFVVRGVSSHSLRRALKRPRRMDAA